MRDGGRNNRAPEPVREHSFLDGRALQTTPARRPGAHHFLHKASQSRPALASPVAASWSCDSPPSSPSPHPLVRPTLPMSDVETCLLSGRRPWGLRNGQRRLCGAGAARPALRPPAARLPAAALGRIWAGQPRASLPAQARLPTQVRLPTPAGPVPVPARRRRGPGLAAPGGPAGLGTPTGAPRVAAAKRPSRLGAAFSPGAGLLGWGRAEWAGLAARARLPTHLRFQPFPFEGMASMGLIRWAFAGLWRSGLLGPGRRLRE